MHCLLLRLAQHRAVPLARIWRHSVPTTAELWLVRAVHRFGDPDTFGDLAQPLEKSIQDEARPADRSQDQRPERAPTAGGAARSRYWERASSAGARRQALAPGEQQGRGPLQGQSVQGESGEVEEVEECLRDHWWQGSARGDGENVRTEAEAGMRKLSLEHGVSGAIFGDERLMDNLSESKNEFQRWSGSPEEKMDNITAVIDWDLVEEDEEDVEAEKLQEAILQIPKLRLNVHGFARKMKKMVKNGKLKEALELFHNQMLQVDRVQPDSYCYNILIAGCGQAGYSRMAFKLFNDMKKRRLKVNHMTYTSLLNACANGPSAADGRRRLDRLLDNMAQKGYVMNPINYQALIKAYGRCGELERAFETADQMLRLGHPLTVELVCFLLQACISDKEQGYRHALLVWHQMRTKEMTPSIFAYNLLLRAALECGAGDTAIFERAMQAIVSGVPSDGAAVDGGRRRLTAGGAGRPELENRLAESLRAAGALEAAVGAGPGLPDLLSARPSRGGLLQLRHLDTAEARVTLLGGWVGVLQTMAVDAVLPDIKTFSILLKTMPDDVKQEQCLVLTMDSLGVAPDVGFFNQLMKKRAKSKNFRLAKEAFSEMGSRGLKPDIASYGCLAVALKTCSEVSEFLDRLEAAGVRPNVEVLTTLLTGAVRASDPRRALLAMEAFLAHQVRPDRRALLRLEELRLRLRQLTVDKERGRPVPSVAQRAAFADWTRKFLLRYPRWLAEVEAEPEPHPFDQYRVTPLVAAARPAALPGTEEPSVQSRVPLADRPSHGHDPAAVK